MCRNIFKTTTKNSTQAKHKTIGSELGFGHGILHWGLNFLEKKRFIVANNEILVRLPS